MSPPDPLRESIAHDLIESGNEHFQIAAHPGRVLFWSADSAGRCEIVSGNWLELTGQSAEAARDEGWLAIVHPEDRERIEQALRQAVDNRQGFYQRYRLGRPDGRWMPVLHDASIRRLPSGKFNGLIATLTDESNCAEGERLLETATRQVYDFLDEVGLAALAIDPQGKLLHINGELAAALEIDAPAAIGSDWIESFVIEEDRPHIRQLLADDRPLPRETEYQLQIGQERRLYRWHLTLLRNFAGHPVSIALMGSDITRWRQLGNQFRLTAQMFDSSMEAMVITDRDNRIVSVNPAFTTLTGYRREEAIGQDPRILQSGRHDAAFYQAMWQSILEDGYWRGDIWDRRKDGSQYPKFLAITAIRDESGEIANYSAIFYDVSERLQLEERLENLAHYDSLTQLPNRMLLQDRLEQAILAADRYQQHFALLFIDLDGFKPVNDQFGHALGDAVLREVARRLQDNLRAVDTAARLGGDEFVVILNDIGNREHALQVADKLIAALAAPYELGGHQPQLAASIGVSLYPNEQGEPADLLRQADEAMYAAKQAGKCRVVCYGGVG